MSTDSRNSSQAEKSWLEAALRLPLAADRRKLSRWWKRAGAFLVWQDGGRVRSVWPDSAENRTALQEAANNLSGLQPAIRAFQARDPQEIWHLAQGQAIGPSLNLAPAWMGVEPSRDTIIIDALTAFGAGDHPSTLLNLEIIARLELTVPEDAWLADIGAGTGILAIGMALLFQHPVAAVDPDPASVRAVARNRSLNPLAAPLVHFVRGLHSCLCGPFPLAAANLPGPILLNAGPQLVDMLAPGGSLVVSGFREEFTPEVEKRFTQWGLEIRQVRTWQGWAGALLKKQPG